MSTRSVIRMNMMKLTVKDGEVEYENIYAYNPHIVGFQNCVRAAWSDNDGSWVVANYYVERNHFTASVPNQVENMTGLNSLL